MKLKRLFLLLMAFVIGLTLVLTGCNGGVDTPKANRYAQATGSPYTPAPDNPLIKKTNMYDNGYKFDPPVTVSVIRYYGPQVRFQAGESIDNNVWTQAYEKYCGIKLKSLFTVTDFTKYDLKVTTSIATDSLPDIMPIYTTLFFRVADSGRTKDLRPYYDKYLDAPLKTYMETAFGGTAYQTCFRNGILAALAPPSGQNPSMQWIRQDWLDRYNQPWPATINDSIKLMKFFCKKNPGAPASPQTFAFPINTNVSTGFENAFGAYSGIWIDDENGGLMRSDVSPKWKTVLQILSDLYADGYLDPDFTLNAQSVVETQMTNQQYGFDYNYRTAPDGLLNNTIAYNPKAIWKSGEIMDENGAPAKMQVSTRVADFTCVNKKSKYPEALMFLMNVYGDLIGGVGIEFRKYHDFLASDGTHYDSFFYPFATMKYPIVDNGAVIAAAQKANDLSKLTGEQLGIIEKFKDWTEKKDSYGWRLWAILSPGGSAETQKKIINSNNIYPDRGWGPETQAWIDHGPDLSSNRTTMFSRIVRGDVSVEAGFDEWVTYFTNNGGQDATTEISEWWKEVGKASIDNFTKTNK
ncbi:MAG: hypothetical protein WCL54_05990 [Clostridia bacterium]